MAISFANKMHSSPLSSGGNNEEAKSLWNDCSESAGGSCCHDTPRQAAESKASILSFFTGPVVAGPASFAAAQLVTGWPNLTEMVKGSQTPTVLRRKGAGVNEQADRMVKDPLP